MAWSHWYILSGFLGCDGVMHKLHVDGAACIEYQLCTHQLHAHAVIYMYYVCIAGDGRLCFTLTLYMNSSVICDVHVLIHAYGEIHVHALPIIGHIWIIPLS